MTHEWVVTSPDFIAEVVEEDGVILYADPALVRFTGQRLTQLWRWVNKHDWGIELSGDEYEADETGVAD